MDYKRSTLKRIIEESDELIHCSEQAEYKKAMSPILCPSSILPSCGVVVQHGCGRHSLYDGVGYLLAVRAWFAVPRKERIAFACSEPTGMDALFFFNPTTRTYGVNAHAPSRP